MEVVFKRGPERLHLEAMH